LAIAVILTFAFAVIEALAGWWSGSLALLGDAGHMVTDSVALLIAAVVARISLLPPSPRHSFGMARAELVAVFVNAAFMLAVVGMLIAEGVGRILEPVDVKGGVVALVAGAGLVLNLGVAWVLSRGEQNLNVRAAMLHVAGDVLGSIAALVSGVVVMLTGWTRVDPALTFLIAALIGYWSLRLAREALHALMEGVPFHLSLPEIGKAMATVPGVVSVHDLHGVVDLRQARSVVGARGAGAHRRMGRRADGPARTAAVALRDRACDAAARNARPCSAAVESA